jgi:hypothetical protein
LSLYSGHIKLNDGCNIANKRPLQMSAACGRRTNQSSCTNISRFVLHSKRCRELYAIHSQIRHMAEIFCNASYTKRLGSLLASVLIPNKALPHKIGTMFHNITLLEIKRVVISGATYSRNLQCNAPVSVTRPLWEGDNCVIGPELCVPKHHGCLITFTAVTKPTL